MASRLSSAWLSRAAVAVAVFALPLFAVGVAQAAIAGGNPSTTSGHPDIRSATALDSSDVQVCFDKALSSSSDVFTTFDDMFLVGYNTNSNDLDPIGATLDNKNGNCVDLAFNTHSGSLDLGQFTAVVADRNAVQTSGSGGLFNYADSTTLLSSTTHNGTVGLSSAPDLVGPSPVASASSTPNDIAYTFDQAVDPTTIDPTGFFYENTTGQMCESVNAFPGSTPSTVIAEFPNVTTGTGNYTPAVQPTGDTTADNTFCRDTVSTKPSVTNARRVWTAENAVSSVADSGAQIFSAQQGTNMPTAANGGATNLASLVSGVLSSNGSDVSYTFDHPINASDTNADDFFVTLANGSILTGSTASIGNASNNVVVTFDGSNGPSMNKQNEYAVQAGVYPGAVQATTGSPLCFTSAESNLNSDNCTDSGAGTFYSNSPGAVPIGGNAGAFARGFTTSGDVFAVTFNRTSNVATVFLDQRVQGYCDGFTPGTAFSTTDCNNTSAQTTSNDYINLLDAAGNDLGSPTAVVIPSTPNAGPVAVTMDIDPAVMAENPTQIALGYNAFNTGLDANANNNCGNDTFLDNSGGCDDAYSIPQIVEQTTVAGHVKAIKVAKKAKKAKKIHRAHRAHRKA